MLQCKNGCISNVQFRISFHVGVIFHSSMLMGEKVYGTILWILGKCMPQATASENGRGFLGPSTLSHKIHGTGIFAYIYHGPYVVNISYMDCMGMGFSECEDCVFIGDFIILQCSWVGSFDPTVSSTTGGFITKQIERLLPLVHQFAPSFLLTPLKTKYICQKLMVRRWNFPCKTFSF